jgi:hypothetical protein
LICHSKAGGAPSSSAVSFIGMRCDEQPRRPHEVQGFWHRHPLESGATGDLARSRVFSGAYHRRSLNSLCVTIQYGTSISIPVECGA